MKFTIFVCIFYLVAILSRKTFNFLPIKNLNAYLAAHDQPAVAEECVLAGEGLPLLLGLHLRLLLAGQLGCEHINSQAASGATKYN